MPKVYETSERATKDYLKTHYYKANFEPMMNRGCEILEQMGLKIVGINQDYFEISAVGDYFDVTLKIFQYGVNETALDLFVDSRILFDFGKTKKKVFDVIYKGFNEKFELKGLSLHP